MKKVLTHEEELEIAENKLGLKSSGNNDLEDNSEEEITKITLSNGDEITFNVGYITGRDILRIKDDYFRLRKRKAGMFAELDDYYYTLVAASITNQRASYFLDLKAKDFNEVMVFVKGFLTQD
ncbi:MAG: hypothetical protein ACRC6K_03790 [Fusobacteriaceae bacterium]